LIEHLLPYTVQVEYNLVELDHIIKADGKVSAQEINEITK